MTKSLLGSFEEKYVPEPNTGCWLWTARANKKGYGKLYHSGVEHFAHRLSYELHKGPIPPGICVLHRCDTPACVNCWSCTWG